MWVKEMLVLSQQRKMRDKEQQKYVGFLPANEGMSYGLYKGSGKPSGANGCI